MAGLKVGLVGVGPVGDAIVNVLRQHNFPVEELRVMATSCRTETLCGEDFLVGETCESAFAGLDVVFFAGREGAKGASVQWGECALAAGAWCIDNGSDFRLDPQIPLVVPEVNMDAVTGATRFIANPNCSTIQMVVVLDPLHRQFGLERVVVSTYQSVSGTGKEAVEELKQQIGALERGEPVVCEVYPHQVAYNCLPHIDVFGDNGYTKEEIKMVEETRKIMGIPGLLVTATCARVPVFVGHSESVNCQFKKPVEPDEARAVLAGAQGVVVVDDPSSDLYPLATDCAGKDPSYVGRIRKDFSAANALNLWIVSDNLRKGAALNAVQIAELLLD
jgi:aspartate-semialdehyde dehydrogenase